MNKKPVLFIRTAMNVGLAMVIGLTGPAFAKGPPDVIDDLAGHLEAVENIQNLLEPKTIFLTSTPHSGDLGGLAGADLICQGLADASLMVPQDKYVALLSADGFHNRIRRNRGDNSTRHHSMDGDTKERTPKQPKL